MLFYSILFYFILFYSILSYSVLCYSILFYSILSYSVLCYSILFYPILFYVILFYSVLFYVILFYSILFYSILFHSTPQYLSRNTARETRRLQSFMYIINYCRRLWFSKLEIVSQHGNTESKYIFLFLNDRNANRQSRGNTLLEEAT
jgi:hypothetical protein